MIFEVGPFALRYYGLFIAIGIVVATWLTGRELDRKGMDGTLALDSLFFIVPLGFVGARAYHVATDYELYAGDPFPGVFEVWNGGLGIYGGVIGGFNYFNQELFGRPSDLPWAIRIAPENRPAEFADAASFHPTFLYESIWDLIVCLILLWVARRFAASLKNGDIAVLYVSLYSFGRFFVESLRVDPAFLIGGTIRGNLLVSSILALGFAMILLLRHSGSKRTRNS